MLIAERSGGSKKVVVAVAVGAVAVVAVAVVAVVDVVVTCFGKALIGTKNGWHRLAECHLTKRH